MNEEKRKELLSRIDNFVAKLSTSYSVQNRDVVHHDILIDDFEKELLKNLFDFRLNEIMRQPFQQEPQRRLGRDRRAIVKRDPDDSGYPRDYLDEKIALLYQYINSLS